LFAQVFDATVATHRGARHCGAVTNVRGRSLCLRVWPGQSCRVADMVNAFGIPDDIERSIRARDTVCVYCGRRMKEHPRVRGCPRDKATIEHLNFDGPFYWDEGLHAEDVVICCQSCNASRGDKPLHAWFESAYCLARGINARTVASPVKEYLERNVRGCGIAGAKKDRAARG
jgi:hypothetical protein